MSFENVENNSKKPLIKRRNEFFSAITRTKVWCTITGLRDGENVFEEMSEIINGIKNNNPPIIKFPAPDSRELERELESEFKISRLDDFDDGIKEIKDLIRKGENKRIEFKETAFYCTRDEKRVSYLKEEIAKEVCSFANTDGGTLLIGIDDDKRIKGIERDLMILGKSTREKCIDQFELELNNILSDRLSSTFCSGYVVLKFSKIYNELICIIEVEKSPEPIYYKKKNSIDFFVRNGSSKIPLKIHEAVKYINNHWEKSEQLKEAKNTSKKKTKNADLKETTSIKDEVEKKDNEDLDKKNTESKSYMEKSKEKYPRAYEYWTEEEEDILMNLIKAGKGIKEISNQLKRQPSAIKSRLSKMDSD